MSRRGRTSLALAAAVVALVAPGAASAHAYLVKTSPAATGILNAPPAQVALTFDEPVEPRFALISVTDAAGRQEWIGSPHRASSSPDTLVVRLRPRIPEGWYLVYWRAISADGHPVQGVFTFAVGPNPGPTPEFRVQTSSQTATTPRLVAERWIVFATVMAAVGLLAFRLVIARPAIRRAPGVNLRRVTIAFWVAAGGALLYIPVYLLYATAAFALRSPWDLGTIVPLLRTTAFGRGYVDLELCFALFCVAAAIAIRVDRPDREVRSIAEIVAGLGAVAAAAAVLIVPGASGHPAQTSPRGLSLALDWAHLGAGSLWLGGLVGLFVVWRAMPAESRVPGLAIVVPRFSNVAFWSVAVLLGTGITGTVIHMPTLAALWQTHYGQAILVKSGLLVAAMLLAASNLLRHRPALVAADGDETSRLTAAVLIRLFAGAEAVLALGAVCAAAILTSLAPPPRALASAGSALAHVGPGRVASVVHKDGYTLRVLVSPNKAVATNSFALEIDKGGAPLRGADVKLTFAMLDMQMADQVFQLTETQPGVYSRPAPAFVMAGHWGLSFEVTPKTGAPFTAVIVDRAAG